MDETSGKFFLQASRSFLYSIQLRDLRNNRKSLTTNFLFSMFFKVSLLFYLISPFWGLYSPLKGLCNPLKCLVMEILVKTVLVKVVLVKKVLAQTVLFRYLHSVSIFDIVLRYLYSIFDMFSRYLYSISIFDIIIRYCLFDIFILHLYKCKSIEKPLRFKTQSINRTNFDANPRRLF